MIRNLPSRMLVLASPLLALGLSACVTTDELYADYQCDICQPTVPVITAMTTAVVGEPVETVRWEQAVYFEFDEAVLLTREIQRLDENIAVLTSQLPEASVVVRGYTDSFNSNAYNVALATRRVKAVADYLSANGLSAARVIPAPVGEATRLYDVDETATQRATNRRVEMILVDAQRKPLVLNLESVDPAEGTLKIGNEGNNGIFPEDGDRDPR